MPDPSPKQARPLLLNPLLLGGLALLSVQLWRFRDFLIDDAYISLVYAKNALAGNGLTFNGQYVAGFSNLLWVLAMLVCGKLGMDLVLATRLLSIGCTFGLFGLVVWRTLRFHDATTAGLCGVLLACTTPLAVWTMAGLETIGFALALISVVIALDLETPDRPRWSLIGLSTLPLLRPEGIGVVGALLGWQAIRLVGAKQPIQWRTLSRYLLPLSLYGLNLLWHNWYYGAPLPNTVYAKTGSLALQIRDGISYVAQWITHYIVFVLSVLWALFMLIRARARQSWVGLLVWVILAYVGFIVISGGDWMPSYRFFIPIWTLFILIIVDYMGLVRELYVTHAKNKLLYGVGIALLINLVWLNPTQAHYVQAMQQLTHTDELIGQRIRAISQPTDLFAVVDAGAIPYYSELPTLDMVGLNDQHIAHLDSGFMQKYDNHYILAHKPTFIQIHVAENDEVIYPINFIGTADLWYSAEFQRWYQRIPELIYVWRRRDQPLDASQFYAVGYQMKLPATLPANAVVNQPLTLTNQGGLAWQAEAYGQPWGAVNIVATWRNASGVTRQIVNLPHTVQPQSSLTLDLPLQTPDQTGMWTLTIELVREGWGTFAEHGAPVFEQTIELQ